MSELLNNYCSLTLSRPVPHSVIWVCLQPFPPVRPQTAGLYCFPFFTNTCSIPTWWPAILCRNDRHRFPSFQGGLRGSTSRAPRPVLLLPVSGMVRYLPPWEVNCITEKERTVNMGLHGSLRQKTKHRGMFRLGFFFLVISFFQQHSVARCVWKNKLLLSFSNCIPKLVNASQFLLIEP